MKMYMFWNGRGVYLLKVVHYWKTASNAKQCGILAMHCSHTPTVPYLWQHIVHSCWIILFVCIKYKGWGKFILKLKFRKYPLIHTNYIISHSTILKYSYNIWYGSYAEKKYWTRKTMISTGLPICNLAWTVEAFPRRETWPAYDSGRKRENNSAWKHCIIVASTCRRSVEFGRYVTWLWMANCVSVMTKNAAFV